MHASAHSPVDLFWAIVRIILGIAQMSGAIILAICLVRYGAGRETIIALSLTLGAVVLSVVLFQLLKVQDKNRP